MRWMALAGLTIVALAGCTSAPAPIRPLVSDTTTFLGLAAHEVTLLDDDLARAELYTKLADGYRRLGQDAEMTALAKTALQIVRGLGTTEESVRARLDLVPLFIAAGDDAAASSILDAAYEFAAAALDPATKASLLPDIVREALVEGEVARPVVREAVDELLVVEDPAQRADALIVVASIYQQSDAALPMTGLIQQAIPAVRSASGSYRRSELFARLAALAVASGDDHLAERMLENVQTEIDAAPQPSDETESALVLKTIDRLASMRKVDEAFHVVDHLENPYDESRALAIISRYTGDAGVRSIRLARAGELASRLRDAQQFVDANTRVGVAYVQAGEVDAAIPLAGAAAQRVSSDRTVYSRIDPAGRVAALLTMADQLQAVRDLLTFAPDNYVRGVVAVQAANQLIADGRLGVADDFLTSALTASDEATYLADGLRQQIVTGFAQTGSVRLAIRTIERMRDELLRTQSVVDLAVRAEIAGTATPLDRADLASVLASR